MNELVLDKGYPISNKLVCLWFQKFAFQVL